MNVEEWYEYNMQPRWKVAGYESFEDYVQQMSLLEMETEENDTT